MTDAYDYSDHILDRPAHRGSTRGYHTLDDFAMVVSDVRPAQDVGDVGTSIVGETPNLSPLQQKLPKRSSYKVRPYQHRYR